MGLARRLQREQDRPRIAAGRKAAKKEARRRQTLRWAAEQEAKKKEAYFFPGQTKDDSLLVTADGREVRPCP